MLAGIELERVPEEGIRKRALFIESPYSRVRPRLIVSRADLTLQGPARLRSYRFPPAHRYQLHTLP